MFVLECSWLYIFQVLENLQYGGAVNSILIGHMSIRGNQKCTDLYRLVTISLAK